MSLHVIEQLEATIQSGSVDVQVELLGEADAPTHAQLLVTADDADDLTLDLRDVEALRDLAARAVSLLAPPDRDLSDTSADLHIEGDPEFKRRIEEEQRSEPAASTQPPSPQAEVQDCETCEGSGEAWSVAGERGVNIGPCPDCNGTGKQPPAEPQGDVVEVLANSLAGLFITRPGPHTDYKLIKPRLEKAIADLTPLLALEVKERLGSDEIKHLIARVVIRKHHGYGVDDEGMPHDCWGKPMTATRNHAEKTAGHVVGAVLAALDTPAPSEPEEGHWTDKAKDSKGFER